MTKKWWFWALVVVAALVVLFVASRVINAANGGSSANAYQTQTIQRGTLTASIGATGTVEARQEAALTFGISGRVANLNIKIGDHVSEGQVLAEMDPAYYPSAVISAQASLINAQKTLDNLRTSTTSIAQAELALANAQKALDDAQTAYDNALTNYNNGYLEQAQKNVNEALSDLENLRRNNKGDFLAQIKIYQAYKTYVNAVHDLENAQRLHDLGYGLGTADSKTKLDIAKGQLDVAKGNLADAQAGYDRVSNGIPADDIAAAQAQVDSAQAILNQTKVVAPFSGTVLSVGINPGDLIQPGALVAVVADISELHVDVAVAEVDFNKVAVGQPATFVLDAVPNITYHGTVKTITLSSSSVGGTVSFPVTVVMTDQNTEVLPGMTAAVDIQVENLANVLLVPNRAVRTLNGQLVVYTLKSGVLVPVDVALGASNDTESELTGGNLKEGDTVVLNPPNSILNSAPNSSGGGGGGGFLRRVGG